MLYPEIISQVHVEEVPRFDNIQLDYAGVRRQRYFLEGFKKDRVKELDEYWNQLDNTRMEAQDTAVSSTNYALLKTGEFRLEDILDKGVWDEWRIIF
jgi:hypothetical protein